jgi:hypothetical protein
MTTNSTATNLVGIVSPTLRKTIFNLLQIRQSALYDIAGVDPMSFGRAQWYADRVRDIDYANRSIARYARDLNVAPYELIAHVEAQTS